MKNIYLLTICDMIWSMGLFGERLKTLRNKNDLSQREMGAILGVSPSLVGMFETSNRDPDTDMLIKIADYFKVTTDYLLGRVDNPQGIVLEGDRLPQKYKDKGLNAIALLKQALDENGVLTPESEQELSLLIAESRIRMAASPAYRKSIKSDGNS